MKIACEDRGQALKWNNAVRPVVATLHFSADKNRWEPGSARHINR